MSDQSQKAFAILAREHEPRLRAFVRAGVADPGATDDLVQESLITAWNRLADYESDKPFAAWLRGIARNKVLEHFRRAAAGDRRRAPLTAELLDRIGQEQDRLLESDTLDIVEQLRPLRACIAMLPAQDRAILDHHYTQRRPCRVIAEQLGLHHEAVKKRLQRIRQEVRDCILGKLSRGNLHA